MTTDQRTDAVDADAATPETAPAQPAPPAMTSEPPTGETLGDRVVPAGPVFAAAPRAAAGRAGVTGSSDAPKRSAGGEAIAKKADGEVDAGGDDTGRQPIELTDVIGEESPVVEAPDDEETADVAPVGDFAFDEGAIDGGASSEADASTAVSDPSTVADRLERFAVRLRAEGARALESSRDADDPLEGVLAAALARHLGVDRDL